MLFEQLFDTSAQSLGYRYNYNLHEEQTYNDVGDSAPEVTINLDFLFSSHFIYIFRWCFYEGFNGLWGAYFWKCY